MSISIAEVKQKARAYLSAQRTAYNILKADKQHEAEERRGYAYQMIMEKLCKSGLKLLEEEVGPALSIRSIDVTYNTWHIEFALRFVGHRTIVAKCRKPENERVVKFADKRTHRWSVKDRHFEFFALALLHAEKMALVKGDTM